jgi:hypothetical protein
MVVVPLGCPPYGRGSRASARREGARRRRPGLAWSGLQPKHHVRSTIPSQQERVGASIPPKVLYGSKSRWASKRCECDDVQSSAIRCHFVHRSSKEDKTKRCVPANLEEVGGRRCFALESRAMVEWYRVRKGKRVDTSQECSKSDKIRSDVVVTCSVGPTNSHESG